MLDAPGKPDPISEPPRLYHCGNQNWVQQISKVPFFANFHEFSTFENEKNNYYVYIDMFIELFITNIAILNYHSGYLLLLRFEKKLKVFAFRQKFTEKYFMQILNAVKA